MPLSQLGDARGGRSGPEGSAGRRLLAGLAVGAMGALAAKDLNLAMLVSYWKPRAPLVAVFALAAALLWLTPLRRTLAVVCAAVGALWLAVAFTPLTARLVPRVTRVDPPGTGDAIFVFSSALQPDGEPSPAAEARLLHGFELMTQQAAPRLILSELPPPHEGYTALAQSWMQRLHLAGELRTVGPVRNTHDEALAVADLCRREGWTRVLAVTSPTHARRAAAILEHEGLAVVSSPAVETRFDVEGLAYSDDRLKAFGPVMHDLIGWWVYRARGWIGPR